MKIDFLTIEAMFDQEITEKRSRFIAYIAPAITKHEADEFYTLIRTRHRDARHNVPAYRIGVENIEEWCNDDGEPSGTAGKPMLELLRSSELTNVALMVTRYFGGSLLGTGGLVRAYGGVVAMLIDKLPIVKKQLYQRMFVETDYKNIGKIKRVLDEHGIFIGMECAQNVVVTYDIKYDKRELAKSELIEICAGQVVIMEGDNIYI